MPAPPTGLPIRGMNEYLSALWASPDSLRIAGLALGAVALYLYLKRPRRLRIVTVIDGDTLMAINPRGQSFKLRLKGVDCPELGQRMSFEAKEFVSTFVLGKWVLVKFSGKDKYERYVARVTAGGKDLSKELVREGLAFPMKGSGLGLVALKARVAGRGVWSGFWQAKPWEADSRSAGLLSFFNKSKRFRRHRSDKLEREHKRRKK